MAFVMLQKEHMQQLYNYLRVVDTTGNVQVILITSKTKVAPIKRMTIPRLELCGAYLLARLLLRKFSIYLSTKYMLGLIAPLC